MNDTIDVEGIEAVLTRAGFAFKYNLSGKNGHWHHPEDDRYVVFDQDRPMSLEVNRANLRLRYLDGDDLVPREVERILVHLGFLRYRSMAERLGIEVTLVAAGFKRPPDELGLHEVESWFFSWHQGQHSEAFQVNLWEKPFATASLVDIKNEDNPHAGKLVGPQLSPGNLAELLSITAPPSEENP